MKKHLKTLRETATGRNIRSIDLRNLSKKENKILIQEAEKGKLLGYHAVKVAGKPKYLRSNPDRKKKNNLDPKISR